LLVVFFCPVLLIALTITALLSLLLRDIRDRTITVYLVASLGTWALVLLAPMFIQDAGDGSPPPSLAQRAGLTSELTQAAEVGIFWACCGLIAITWAAIIVARTLGPRRRAAASAGAK
jgi:hypothetical protein